jgi:phage gp29-like protein
MGKTLHLPREAHHFATARPAGNLYADQANNYYLDLFNLFPDFDEVMRRAGLSRTELRKLESDDEIGAATDTRREAVISTPWHLEGADGKPATGPDVDFLQEQLDPWIEQMARAAWAAVPFGYSVWETVYARLGGNSIGIARLWEKPFEWFAPRQEGGLLYRSLENPQGVEVDAVLKFFCTVREPTYRMPYGRALFSQLYWPWFFRKMGWQFWMKFLERWGTPILLGQTAGDKDKMAKALAKAVQNSVIAVGKDDDVEALGIGAGSANFEAFERAVTARIQKTVLGQTLTTDAGGSTGKSGSYALGKIHNQVREDRRNADLRLITKTIQRQVDALWVLNGFGKKPPMFKFEDDTGLQLERAQRDNQLLSSGKVSFSEEYYLRAYDFEEGEVVVTPDGTATGAGQPGGERDPGGAKASLRAGAGGPRFTREQQAVEELVASAADNLPSPIDPEAIRNAIRAAKDPDDLIDRLGVLFADADKFTFARIIERALFASHVMGFAHATPQGRA